MSIKVTLLMRDSMNRTSKRTYGLTTADPAQAAVDAALLANEMQDNTNLSVYSYRIVNTIVVAGAPAPQARSNVDKGATLRAFGPGYRGFLTMQVPDPVGALTKDDGTIELNTEFGALNHFFAYFVSGSIATFEDGKQTPEWMSGKVDR
jgi:hypothetical protein